MGSAEAVGARCATPVSLRQAVPDGRRHEVGRRLCLFLSARLGGSKIVYARIVFGLILGGASIARVLRPRARLMAMATALAATFKRAVAPAFGDFSQPGTLQWEEVPMPTPTGNEVLIQAKAAGLNSIDWKIGEYLADLATLPIQPLSDCAGTIVAVGPDAAALKVGDDVCANTCKFILAFHSPVAAGRVCTDC